MFPPCNYMYLKFKVSTLYIIMSTQNIPLVWEHVSTPL